MKNILILIFSLATFPVVGQNNSAIDTLDFGRDSLGITKDYYNNDSVMARNNGLKFFAFLHKQGLETYMRCGECFFLYFEPTKTNYCVCESESCRTHKNIPVSVKKNNQEIGFVGLREVASLIIEHRSHLRKSLSKNSLEKGEVGYIILSRTPLIKK